MGSKNKLKKFNDLKDFKNVLEPSRDVLIDDKFKIKGKWSNFFKNNNPIILELACGKGEYSYELAKLYPDKNFIGIDIKGSRIKEYSQDFTLKLISTRASKPTNASRGN